MAFLLILAIIDHFPVRVVADDASRPRASIMLAKCRGIRSLVQTTDTAQGPPARPRGEGPGREEVSP